LFVTFVIAIAVAIGFAFTIIGTIAEAVAVLALLGLTFRGVASVVRHPRKT
jgi:hypothetical protein